MKRLLTTLAAAAFTVLAVVGVAPPAWAFPSMPASTGPARAAQNPRSVQSASPGSAIARWGAAAPADQSVTAAPASDTPSSMVRVDINSLSPQVVASDSGPTVTIAGKISNSSDRTITNIDARIQRYDPVTSESAATNAAAATTSGNGVAVTDWVPVNSSMAPGQSVDFQLTVPLTGGTADSLSLSKPGIYPLLVNANGTPAFGRRTRLGTASTLLPVLALPGVSPPSAQAVPASATLLWPIAANPQVVTLASDGKPVLRDDNLAVSLAPGGRLSNLVEAVRKDLPLSSPSAQSLCLAIDPDLLATVEVMAKGYLVSAGQGTVDGKGATVATQWLDALRTAAQGRCVIALPYANADLVALTRAGMPDLAAAAVGKAQEIDIPGAFQPLGIQPLPDVVWPVDGLIDDPTAADLAKSGTKTLILDPRTLQPGAPAGPVRLAVAGAPSPLAVQIDPLVSGALGSAGASQQPAMQSALAALVFRAETATPGRSVLIAPPTLWNPSPSESAALLQTMRQVAATQLLQPKRLQELISTPTVDQTATVNYPVAASASEIPPAFTANVLTARNLHDDLVSSMSPDSALQLKPNQFMAPELLGLLRASSSTWRGNEPAAQAVLDAVNQQFDSVEQQVQIASPPDITLTSSDSRLLLSLSNRLPVAVDVRVTLSGSTGVRAGPIEATVPATGSRPLRIAAQVVRSGKFVVDVRMTTQGGAPLGEPSRLQVHSTAYGTITSVITGGAAVVLVVLMSVRIVRRIRASRAGGPPRPSETTTPAREAGDSHEVRDRQQAGAQATDST